MARDRRQSKGGRLVRVADVCRALEAIAPPTLATEWDNVGLLIGEESAAVRRMLLTIDLTEGVVREARRSRTKMVVTYHPPIFRPVLRLTAKATPVAYAAARAGMAVYAIHTALDAAPGGTNDVLAEAVGIADARPLEPTVREGDFKVVAFVPAEDLGRVATAAFAAGAGQVGNYSECCFYTPGVGTFRGGAGSHPTRGRPGGREEVEELRFEVVVGRNRLGEVVDAVRDAHSYETPVIDVYPLRHVPEGADQGRIGRLERAVTLPGLLGRIKRALGVQKVLVAGRRPGRITMAACCAGSCGDVFQSAADGGAEVYVTGEMRHHDALAAAAAGMTVVCVGHSNSERITLAKLAPRVADALPQLKVKISQADRDPFEIL